MMNRNLENKRNMIEDNITNPKHYKLNYKLNGLGIEAIDVIKSVLGNEKFEGYCRGNVIKYILRADSKNGVEDLKKAQVYLNWEILSKENDSGSKD